MEETDISKLSPSEIEELQRKNCVFCHIASGKVPARKVYEDDSCLAVLDINPANPGHVLLMPKEHFTVMFQVPEQLIGHVFIIAKGLSQAGLKALHAKGTTIFAANGTAAGQRAPHFMLHIIPRMAGDNIGIYLPSRALPEKEAGQIASALSAVLGGKERTAGTAGINSGNGGGSSNGSDDGEGKDEVKAKGGEENVVEAEVVKEEKIGKKAKGGEAVAITDLDAITELLTKSKGAGGVGR